MERVARKSCRSQLTKLVNHANEQLVNQLEDINELVVISERIKKANESLDSANERVKSLLQTEKLNDEGLQEEFDKMLEYQDQATQVLSKLQLRIDSHPANGRNASITNETSESNVTQVSRSTGRTQGNNNVKLPKLELRKFKGDLSEWTLFWEQFRTAIHENESLDSVAKFNYLEGVLIGKAAATIAGFTPTAESYEDAIELLKHEYGNKQRIIDTHIQKLLATTPVKSKLDAIGLRRLYNVITSIARNLTALGVNANEYGMMMKSVILNCMPNLMKIDYHRQYPDDKKGDNIGEQIQLLLCYLKLEVESIESSQTPTACGTAPFRGPVREERESRPKTAYHKSKPSEYSAAGLLTTTINACLFCKSTNHMSEKCPEASLTIQQKKEILKRNNCCFRCTKPNHSARFCRNKITCRSCNLRHATSLCDPNYGRDAHTTSLITKNPENVEQVFLQTAKAYISPNDNGNKNAFIRLIIDGGSQLTYVRQDVSRKLGLKILGTRNLSVMPFGVNEKTTPKQYNNVELKLISQFSDEAITFNAIEVPEICFDSFHTPKVDHPMMATLNLADISIGNLPTVNGIALLIGADNLWKVATGEFVRLSKSLTALNTKLGWTLQGPNISGNNEATNVNAVIASTFHVQACEETNDHDMQRFWKLKTIGINHKESQKTLTEEFVEKQIRKKKDRFEVTLPWRNDSAIDNNHDSAFSRVKGLTFRLERNSRSIEDDNAIRELVDNNVAEKVCMSECASEKMYY